MQEYVCKKHYVREKNCLHMCARECVCVCVCVCEREREREGRKREKGEREKRERMYAFLRENVKRRKSVCVSV